MITFPSIITPQSVEWELVSNVQSFTSPLTGATQTLRMPGERWKFSFTYENLDDDNTALLTAFIAKARGGAERFAMGNPYRTTPRGAGGGTPLVQGGSQTGASLVTDGWPISTMVLKTGDFVSVNGELKMVVADVTSNGTGVATITFEPPLRAVPADNAPLTTVNPTATFRLIENKQKWKHNSGFATDFTIEAIESWV